MASFEVIVVFNGSKDGSVESCAQSYPQVKRIELSTNLGFNAANNIGIRESVGHYVLLLNNDTIVLPEAIDRLLQYIASHENVGMVAPKLLNPDFSLQRACHEFPTLRGLLTNAFGLHLLFPNSRLFGWTNMTYWEYTSTQEVDWVSAACVLIDRKALDEVGLLDERSSVAGDFDLCWRLQKKGWKTVFIHDATIIHLLGRTSWQKQGSDAILVRSKSYLLNFVAMYYWFYNNFGKQIASKYVRIAKLDAILRIPVFFMLSQLPNHNRLSAKARLAGSILIARTSLRSLEIYYHSNFAQRSRDGSFSG